MTRLQRAIVVAIDHHHHHHHRRRRLVIMVRQYGLSATATTALTRTPRNKRFNWQSNNSVVLHILIDFVAALLKF